MSPKKKDPIEQNKSEIRGIGHNSEVVVKGEVLNGFIKAIEKLEARKQQILQEQREEYGAAKAAGYDNKVLRRIVKERRMEPEKLKEQEETYALYTRALEMLGE